MVVDENYSIPTWADCYAVGDADMRFPEETEPPEPATESDTDRLVLGLFFYSYFRIGHVIS